MSKLDAILKTSEERRPFHEAHMAALKAYVACPDDSSEKEPLRVAWTEAGDRLMPYNEKLQAVFDMPEDAQESKNA